MVSKGAPQGSTYAELVNASKAFFEAPSLDTQGKALPDTNRIQSLVDKELVKLEEVEEDAAAVHPLCHPDAVELCRQYLEQRQSCGTDVEQRVLKDMTLEGFLERLLTKRPLMFMGSKDAWILRDGSQGCGFWEDVHISDPELEPWVQAPWGERLHWAQVIGVAASGNVRIRWHYDGSEQDVSIGQVSWYGRPPQLTMEHYLSYPEIQLSALLSVVVPTVWINDGARDNAAIFGVGGFVRRGTYVAQVGCRLKKPLVQEYELLIATREQNTAENGYGWEAPQEKHSDFKRRSIWAQWLLSRDSFPTYEEAMADRSGRYSQVADGVLLDTSGLRKRLRTVIEPLVLAADNCAAAKGLRAYVRCVGLGLGVWLGACKTAKGELEVSLQQLTAYVEVVRRYSLPSLGVVDLSWFPNGCAKAAVDLGILDHPTQDNIEDFEVQDANNQRVLLKFSNRNPASLVPDGHLLIAQYAWDGNAFPGNEYWSGLRCASGDSAAASCSTIGELQNPMINSQAFQVSKLQVKGDPLHL